MIKWRNALPVNVQKRYEKPHMNIWNKIKQILDSNFWTNANSCLSPKHLIYSNILI